jgi:hypothetical protein
MLTNLSHLPSFLSILHLYLFLYTVFDIRMHKYHIYQMEDKFISPSVRVASKTERDINIFQGLKPQLLGLNPN